MGRFQDCSEATSGGSPSQDRVIEQAYFDASERKKKASGWTVLFFNVVSGTDKRGKDCTEQFNAGVYISNCEINPNGTILCEALCLHSFAQSSTGYTNS